MNYFQAILLSIIEGVTEFLPISSTGHLILASEILKISQSDFIKSFEIFIQLGAIGAIIILYKDTLIKNLGIWKKIITAFVPTAIVGLSLYKFIKYYLLGNTLITIIALLLGGFVFIIIELNYKEKDKNTKDFTNINYRQAFIIGLIQSISVIPGISRSGATILGGMFLGLSRKSAVETSFLLAIPTLFAATALDLYKSEFIFSQNEIFLLIIGFVGSFISAYYVAKFLLHFIKKHNFIGFGIYRIILAVLYFLIVKI